MNQTILTRQVMDPWQIKMMNIVAVWPLRAMGAWLWVISLFMRNEVSGVVTAAMVLLGTSALVMHLMIWRSLEIHRGAYRIDAAMCSSITGRVRRDRLLPRDYRIIPHLLNKGIVRNIRIDVTGDVVRVLPPQEAPVQNKQPAAAPKSSAGSIQVQLHGKGCIEGGTKVHKCPQCGAPLDAPKGERVRCAYCGSAVTL